MEEKTKEILKAALCLSETERLQLVDCLMETLPPENPDLSEEEFAAELERRHLEALRDPTVLVPWSELKREL